MRKSETQVQFSFETLGEYLRNELRRSKGKRIDYLINRYQWKHYPKKHKVPDFPLNIDIEVSSRCQIQCAHCFRQYMEIGENDLMPLDMYKKIVKECGEHGLFTLKFSMRGEPLLHPDIVASRELGPGDLMLMVGGVMITIGADSDIRKKGVKTIIFI